MSKPFRPMWRPKPSQRAIEAARDAFAPRGHWTPDPHGLTPVWCPDPPRNTVKPATSDSPKRKK